MEFALVQRRATAKHDGWNIPLRIADLFLTLCQEPWPSPAVSGRIPFNLASMFQTYTPSGNFSPVFLLWLVLSLLIIFIAGVLYGLGLDWIPIVYVSFLLTLGMGWLSGGISQRVIKHGKVRNRAIALAIAVTLVLGSLAAKFAFQYYSEYQAQIVLVEQMRLEDLTVDNGNRLSPEDFEDFKEEFKRAAINSYTFSEHLKSRVKRGWNLGKGGRNGMPISGGFVYLVWLIEAGLMLFVSVPTALSAAKQPFAEQLDAWADESEVVLVLPITDDEMIQRIISAKTVQELLDVPIPQTDRSTRLATYTINSIPGQELEDAYLTVDLSEYIAKAEGETEIKTSNLVSWAVITSAQRAQLIENSELMNEAIQEYRASQLVEHSAQSNQPVNQPQP
jgi:hypothetical protein